jgi:hypothetical protein
MQPAHTPDQLAHWLLKGIPALPCGEKACRRNIERQALRKTYRVVGSGQAREVRG